MKKRQTSDAVYLLGFFALIITIGTVLLSLPVSWAGKPGYPESVGLIDALFISTSAVCVTGLVTVDTAAFSRFGQFVILSLIQVGGLGIISFTSLLLMIPGHRIPFRRLKTIRGFSVDGVEYDAARIVRNIVVFTALIEAAGAVALYFVFRGAGYGDAAFLGIFHAISAFCNAGFSPFPTSLESFSRNPLLLGIVAALIVSGGIGFIVLQDIERRIRGKRKRLSYHTKLVLSVTAFLILAGALSFWALERNRAFAGMSQIEKIANALFQSITPRTAGFDAISQGSLRQPSRLLTIVLMFIGGAPGSIAGGVKVSTAFLVFLVMVRRADERGDITAFRRRLSGATTSSAVVYFVKAIFLLLIAVLFLSLREGLRGTELEKIIFEAVSAFGTVGLSLGITGNLSDAGKLTIIATMFAGRVGLIALAFPGGTRGATRIVYPEADVLLG
jgi:trk system potassium uptake protein TrkH